MSKTRYYKLSQWDTYLKETKNRKIDFGVTKTTYTKKLKTASKTSIFNEKGEEQWGSLKVIGMVREDARNYMENVGYIGDGYIDFSELIQRPKTNDIICKVDIRSAYWKYALKRGVIANKTDEKLMELFDGRPVEDMKEARLRALGSLATRRVTEFYDKGVLNPRLTEDHTEPTKPLYMDVCRGIDMIMKECSRKIPAVVYYYWDCIFVPKSFEDDVVDFIKKKDYDVRVNETSLYYEFIGNTAYLISTKDEKIYVVKKENRHLLHGL